MVAKASTKAQAKGHKGIGMDGIIAQWYTKLTLKDIENFRADAKRMVTYLTPGDAVLEIAPGPGYLAIELAKLGSYKIMGLDISESFVKIAREQAAAAGVSIDFRQGDAARMPLESDAFNFIVCRSAFKNFSEPLMALNEMHRVLKVGGKAVILDLRADASIAAINRYVDGMGLGAVNTSLTKLTFKHTLLKRAYTKDSFGDLIAKSSFKKHDIQQDPIVLEVYLEK